MPLSEPVPRTPFHTRRIRCEGFRRADGLWDIEGHLTDVKHNGFHSRWRGDVPAGTPIHGMSLRLTLDEAFVIHAVEAVSDHTPFPFCPEVTPNFQRLVGERIAPGWRRRVAQLLGGTQGCTHLVELLGPVATTAIQTIRAKGRIETEARRGDLVERNGLERLVDSCYAWAAGRDAVRFLIPERYTGAAPPEPEA